MKYDIWFEKMEKQALSREKQINDKNNSELEKMAGNSFFARTELIAQQKGLSANLEALIGKEPECTHEIVIPTEFEKVGENYEISEAYCANCGKIVALFYRKQDGKED